jgi:hypothetical protein
MADNTNQGMTDEEIVNYVSPVLRQEELKKAAFDAIIADQSQGNTPPPAAPEPLTEIDPYITPTQAGR